MSLRHQNLHVSMQLLFTTLTCILLTVIINHQGANISHVEIQTLNEQYTSEYRYGTNAFNHDICISISTKKY